MNLYEQKLNNSTLFFKAVEKGLRVGYLDIELSPNVMAGYVTRKAFISDDQILVPVKVTSAVLMSEHDLKPVKYEWNYKGPLLIEKNTVKGGGCDTELLKDLSLAINKYDVIIMQNGDKFDAPVLQDRLCQLNIRPIRNLITIDTLKLSKRSFRRTSHALDSQSKRFGLGGKLKQDMTDCINVLLGCKRTQKERVIYNVKDVTDMRALFVRQLDWYDLDAKTLNLLLRFVHEEREHCVKCAARRQKRYAIEKAMIVNSKGKRQKKWRCKVCNHIWKIKSK